MPSPARRRFPIFAVLGHAAIATWCIYVSIDRSGEPSHYRNFYRHPEAFVQPTHDIAVWCGVITLELALASWLLLHARATAAASFLLGLVAAVGTVMMLPFSMHAPPYFGMHLVFLVFSAGWLFLMSLIAKLASYASEARAPAPLPPRPIDIDIDA